MGRGHRRRGATSCRRPFERRFEAGDHVIAISRDDDTIVLNGKPHPGRRGGPLAPVDAPRHARARAYPRARRQARALDMVLHELDAYVGGRLDHPGRGRGNRRRRARGPRPACSSACCPPTAWATSPIAPCSTRSTSAASTTSWCSPRPRAARAGDGRRAHHDHAAPPCATSCVAPARPCLSPPRCSMARTASSPRSAEADDFIVSNNPGVAGGLAGGGEPVASPRSSMSCSRPRATRSTSSPPATT